MSSRPFRFEYIAKVVNAGKERAFSDSSLSHYELADEPYFTHMIILERKRAERSGKPFFLMLLEGGAALHSLNGGREIHRRLVSALRSCTRETDTVGWYKEHAAVGVIFTEVGTADQKIGTAILAKVTRTLRDNLGSGEVDRLKISMCRYPDEKEPIQRIEEFAFYPDLQKRDTASKASHIVKRVIDVVGSTLALVLLAPVFLIVALAIRLNSKGSVLFKQTRVGQHGIPFTFLKFRSMYVNNDHGIHKEYVSRFISGEGGVKHPNRGNGDAVYKITCDPRITRVGKFLRKTSLDELPQFFNVLKGEMSLVGPRPPLLYEFERYDTWHRRRVLEARPGITGLWQVNGRSRTSFDDMVRLDLRYATRWTLWLDLKILLQTPGAVFSGDGAY
jgi:exopolysaccharide biosynthesis polyprenyl glycosylphosphotransferase